MENTEKKDLGAIFINQNKEKPTSFDASGSFVVDGKKYTFGAYRKEASGKGKMAQGTVFYSVYKIDEKDAAPAAATASTDFNPAELES